MTGLILIAIGALVILIFLVKNIVTGLNGLAGFLRSE